MARHLDAPLELIHPTEIDVFGHPQTSFVPILTPHHMDCVMGLELFPVEVSNPTRRLFHRSDLLFRPNKIPKTQNSIHHLHPDRPNGDRLCFHYGLGTCVYEITDLCSVVPTLRTTRAVFSWFEREAPHLECPRLLDRFVQVGSWWLVGLGSILLQFDIRAFRTWTFCSLATLQPSFDAPPLRTLPR